MKSLNALVSVFAVVPFVVFVGVWSLVAGAHYAAPADASLFDGAASEAFESHFDDEFPLKDLGKNSWAAIQYTLLGEGQDGLVIGDDNWLYTEQEFRPFAGGGENLVANIQSIVGVHRLLQAHDITLVVALLPSKARVYPEHLNGRKPATIHRALYAETRQTLLSAKLFVPNILSALHRCKQLTQAFLKTDTHWTPQGAGCAADQLARAAATRVALNGTTRTRFDTHTAGTERHIGDLQNYLPLSPWFADLQPEPETVSLMETTAQSAKVDLFGAADMPPVALVGTSYSADNKWHFHGALRQSLQRDVINLAEAGKGPFRPMRGLLESGELVRLAPELVIWEIPERYLIQRADDQPRTKTVRAGQQSTCPRKEDTPCASL